MQAILGLLCFLTGVLSSFIPPHSATNLPVEPSCGSLSLATVSSPHAESGYGGVSSSGAQIPIGSGSRVSGSVIDEGLGVSGNEGLMSSGTTQAGNAGVAEAASTPKVNQGKRGIDSISMKSLPVYGSKLYWLEWHGGEKEVGPAYLYQEKKQIYIVKSFPRYKLPFAHTVLLHASNKSKGAVQTEESKLLLLSFFFRVLKIQPEVTIPRFIDPTLKHWPDKKISWIIGAIDVLRRSGVQPNVEISWEEITAPNFFSGGTSPLTNLPCALVLLLLSIRNANENNLTFYNKLLTLLWISSFDLAFLQQITMCIHDHELTIDTIAVRNPKIGDAWPRVCFRITNSEIGKLNTVFLAMKSDVIFNSRTHKYGTWDTKQILQNLEPIIGHTSKSYNLNMTSDLSLLEDQLLIPVKHLPKLDRPESKAKLGEAEKLAVMRHFDVHKIFAFANDAARDADMDVLTGMAMIIFTHCFAIRRSSARWLLARSVTASFKCQDAPGYPIQYMNQKMATKQDAVGLNKHAPKIETKVRFISAGACAILKVYRSALLKLANAKELKLCHFFFVDYQTNTVITQSRQEAVLGKFILNFFTWNRHKITHDEATKLVFWNKPMRSIYVSTFHECQKMQIVRQNVAPTENTAKVAWEHYSSFHSKFRDEFFLMWVVGRQMRKYETCPKFLSRLGEDAFDVMCAKYMEKLDVAYNLVLSKTRGLIKSAQ